MNSQKGVILPMILFGVVAFLSGIGLLLFLTFYKKPVTSNSTTVLTPIASVGIAISDFESCVQSGNPVQESYPRRCVVDGKSFTEVLESSDSAGVINEKQYSSEKYAYQISYPNNYELKVENAEKYDLVDLMNGCFRFYSGREGFEESVQNPYGIPFSRLEQLRGLKPGEKLVDPEDDRTYREDGSYIIKSTYTRIASQRIGGADWDTFEGTNNWENHTINEIYFVVRNDVLYVLDLQYDGPCYGEDPVKVRDSFKFLQ